MGDHTDDVMELALGVVTALEEGTPVSLVALKARRLAQLIEDDAAFSWLRLECGGAMGQPPEREWKDTAAGERGLQRFLKMRAVPDYSDSTTLSIIRNGKIPKNSMFISIPLASIEALIAGAKDEAIAERDDSAALMSFLQSDRRAIIGRVTAAMHEWASHVYVTYRLRRTAGNIFDRFKTTTDPVLAAVCPDALEKLNHAIERAGSDKDEDLANAALSCRRVLKAFADSVYPARDGQVDGRKVGEAEYKNRLWAFVKARGRGALDSAFLAEEEIEGLCKGLDKVYELDSKGVHDRVSREQAQEAVLRTYILLSQLVTLVPSDVARP